MSTSAAAETVGLVLGGGGARGAYEAGALAELLPVLEARGERPRLIVGTSAGAVNTAFLAAGAAEPVATLIPSALDAWETMTWSDVARGIISPASLARAGSYLGEVLGIPGARITSLLDPAPLRRTLRERVDFAEIAANVEAGRLDVVAVVATSARSGRSVVFHHGGTSPPLDRRRGIEYRATELREEHVLASSAIPGVFPAVPVTEPPGGRGWYLDGGTRLNTPVKPALKLGAERIVLIAVTPREPGDPSVAGEGRPDALEAAAQVLVGLLEDRLAADLETLATINELAVTARGGVRAGARAASLGKQPIPYIVIAPEGSDPIAERALAVVRDDLSGPLGAIGSDVGLLARVTAAGADAHHAALLSFLLFAPAFARALIELGRADARRWLANAHDLDDLWQLGPIRGD